MAEALQESSVSCMTALTFSGIVSHVSKKKVPMKYYVPADQRKKAGS